MKKITITLILSILLLLVINTTVFASSTEAIPYSEMDVKQLSQTTGLPTDYIKELKIMYPTDEKFNATIEHYFYCMTPSVTTYSEEHMSEEQWDSIADILEAGHILVTKDSKHLVRHGHAAIMYNNTTSVEILGPDSVSHHYNVSWWGDDYYTCKVFRPNNTSYMSEAGDYAYRNLQGISYSYLPTRYVEDFVNCATLVWKAYYHKGYNIDSDGELWETLLPRDICESSDVKLVKSVNWSGTW